MRAGVRRTVLRWDELGGWRIHFYVTGAGRFVVLLRCRGQPSSTRTKFFSSHAQAEITYFEWRDETIRRVAFEVLTGVKS